MYLPVDFQIQPGYLEKDPEALKLPFGVKARDCRTLGAFLVPLNFHPCMHPDNYPVLKVMWALGRSEVTYRPGFPRVQ